MIISESYMKASKAITLLLCLAVICAGNFEAVSQTSSSNHSNYSGRTWTKQELLNAGFKFSPEKETISSNVIFGGKKSAGKFNGLIVAGTQTRVTIGYVVDGERAFPYLSVTDDEKYKLISLHENVWSYNFKDYMPMSFIVKEIFGLDYDSEDLPARLCKGSYDYSKIAKCFDEFIESGQKIPESAWLGYEINIDGITLNNSNPYPKWLKSKRLRSLTFNGPYMIRTWDRSNRKYLTDSNLKNILPGDMDMRLFGISFDYMPSASDVTGGVLRINRDFEICVENGEIVIRSEIFSKKQWYTGRKIKSDTWNNISVYYTDGTVVLLTDGCAQLAAFRIERPQPSVTLYIESAESYDRPIGKVRNVKVDYCPR